MKAHDRLVVNHSNDNMVTYEMKLTELAPSQ